VRVHDLSTPALLFDADALEHNLATMAAVRPGPALRPHVKAHKCTALAREQARHGHTGFTCATPREVVGLAETGLGDDLLLANETLDPHRLRAMADAPGRVTVAVDSADTIDAAVANGIAEVLIDVNVGLPRCGCPPQEAGRLADAARARGLVVRGVMGYEGHLMVIEDAERQRTEVAKAMDLLLQAHADVGGDVVSAGGTGTYAIHDRVTEVQAGSYALMDTYYAKLPLPFRQAHFLETTVISANNEWAVCDAGLKSLGMDHGNPAIDGYVVWFCSDEHVTFAPAEGSAIPPPGDRVKVIPAHVDPTITLHERAYVVRGDDVLDTWPIDLRGW
jgi:D-serine deaminase-like pyridoxal phosphate-dependent protein